jgi:hypothetical protein
MKPTLPGGAHRKPRQDFRGHRRVWCCGRDEASAVPVAVCLLGRPLGPWPGLTGDSGGGLRRTARAAGLDSRAAALYMMSIGMVVDRGTTFPRLAAVP